MPGNQLCCADIFPRKPAFCRQRIRNVGKTEQPKARSIESSLEAYAEKRRQELDKLIELEKPPARCCRGK